MARLHVHLDKAVLAAIHNNCGLPVSLKLCFSTNVWLTDDLCAPVSTRMRSLAPGKAAMAPVNIVFRPICTDCIDCITCQLKSKNMAQLHCRHCLMLIMAKILSMSVIISRSHSQHHLHSLTRMHRFKRLIIFSWQIIVAKSAKQFVACSRVGAHP